MAIRKQKQQVRYPKQSHKGQKCVRGEPLYYDELKKPITLSLTPTAIDKLSALASNQGLSRSELVEQLLRKM